MNSRAQSLVAAIAAASGQTAELPSMVSRIGLSFYTIKPSINTEPQRYAMWNQAVQAVGQEIAVGPIYCDHLRCIARRQQAFVGLCLNGSWPKDSPIAAESARGHFDVISYLSGHSDAKRTT